MALVTGRHMRNAPGRKTDISDSKWIAGLLRHGPLRGASIPPKYQRQWRSLTRMRKKYQQDLVDFKRRVHKLFQEANIKIDSVLSDLFGLTGRNLMRLLLPKASTLTISEVRQCPRGRSVGTAAKRNEPCVHNLVDPYSLCGFVSQGRAEFCGGFHRGRLTVSRGDCANR